MNTWAIQLLVLLSFSAQCFLVFFASRRNRTNKKWLLMLISAIYTLADWVAPNVLGRISDQQDCSRSCGPCPAVISGDLLAFWAPFLLLHLGSPSNITSLSLDENDTWLEKLVDLCTNVITATLVLSRATPSNLLFPASFLVLLAGTVKYAERTLTLFRGRSSRWDSIAALVENTDLSEAEKNLPTDVESVLGRRFDYDSCNRIRLSSEDMLQLARCFYRNFKGFIVGGVSYGPRQRKFTRDYFLKALREDAFKLVEIELGFIHEDLHTKAGVTHPIIGYLIRIVSFISIIIAFVLFYLHDKHGISKIDIYITYVLLSAALLLEIISFVMVLWSVRGVLALRCEMFEELIAEAMVSKQRWSNSFSRWNLISYCLRDDTNKLIDQLIVMEALKDYKINQTLSTESFDNFPQQRIFEYLCEISEEAKEDIRTAKEKCSGRGNLALRKFECEDLLGWSLDGVDYANGLMRWYIATDICIRITNAFPKNVNRVYCANISEYLLYLLLWKPSMMALAADHWEPIFENAYAKAVQFFHEKSITNPTQASKALLSEVTDNRRALPLPGHDAVRSVWVDGCRLARELISNFEDGLPWDLICAVWIELLVYAAFNSKAITHIRQLGEGGEALTVVWLMMNHLGLGNNFSEEPAHTQPTWA